MHLDRRVPRLASLTTTAVVLVTSLGLAAGVAAATPIINDAPLAHATVAPNPAHAGETVVLDGSGSTDEETSAGDLAYSWDFGDGTAPTGESRANFEASHVYATAGVYTATLTVKDPEGLADTDSVVVEVDDTAPVAAATATPTAALVQHAVAFDAAGTTDAETADSELIFDWDFKDGMTGSGVAPTHAYEAAGTYPVLLTVTDPQGVSDTATVTVTVTNSAPTAEGTITPAAPYVGGTVTFDGTASTDPETPSNLTYDWNFGDASPHGDSAVATHVYDASGTNTVRLTVTDPQGLTHTKTFRLTVAANGAPTAVATASQARANVRQEVTFDGTGSSDPEGTTLSYAWDFGDGTAPASTAVATHAFTSPGPHTVTLTVTDGHGLSGTDTVSVQVGNESPTAALVVTPDPGHALEVLTFDGSGSTDAETPGQLSYSWTFGDGSATTYSSSTQTTHAYDAAGAYTVTLRVRDPKGAVDTQTSDVQVLPNGAPTAVATATPNPVHVGSPVTFDGTGSTDPDGDPLTYTWDFPGGATADTATAQQTFASTGTYQVTLTVADPHGVSDTETITVEVTNAAPDAVATATPDPVHVGSPVTFDGTGSTDPDGDQLTYTWDFPDGDAASGATVQRTFDAAGTYPVTLSVEDGLGGTDSAQVTLTVVNDAPTAAIATDGSIHYVGTAVAFDAGSSGDTESPDGLTYAWDFGDGSTSTDASAQHAFARHGVFTVTLTVTDPQGLTDSATKVVSVARKIACHSSLITRSTQWRVVASSAAEGGNYCDNLRPRTTPGGTMTFDITGSQVGFAFARSTAGGSAEVYVDGVLKGTISFKSSATEPRFGYVKRFTGFGRGSHHVNVTMVNGAGYVDHLLIYGGLG